MWKSWIASVAVAAATCLPVSAEPLPKASGRVVLEVLGEISSVSAPATAHPGGTILRRPVWPEVETNTSFITGPHRFAEPMLNSVLMAVGANESMMKAAVTDDIFALPPFAPAGDRNLSVAIMMNEKKMRIRDQRLTCGFYPISQQEAAAKPSDPEIVRHLNRLQFLR